MLSKKNIVIIISVCLVLVAAGFGGYYFYQKKIYTENQQNQNGGNEQKSDGEEIKNNPVENDLTTKEGLLAALKDAGEKEDYEQFGQYLKMVYKNLWDTDVDFQKVESEIYMNATTKYFDKGNLDEALRVSTIVYNQVSQGWRFRYLRVRVLEKIGRDAFNQNDLAKAEDNAMKILQMTYRPEGANLLADVYIKKIENNIASGDKNSAISNLNYVWDFEVSQDRRDRLNELKTELLK